MQILYILRRFLLVVALISSVSSFAQDTTPTKPTLGKRKHGFYFYWGYNRANFSKSNIHFKGDGYDFRIKGMKAEDRQSEVDITYVNPAKISIPQYNYRLGYYLKNNWNVSIGFDHMKYVMVSHQEVQIDGHIDKNYNSTYGGEYNNETFSIDPAFLELEHTNGLNYINVQLDKSMNLAGDSTRKFRLSGALGLGTGIVYPKSDIKLMHNERNDQWHLAGYGVSAITNLRLTFSRLIFFEYNLKGGFIHMPSVLTTSNKSDRANQSFFFLERFAVIGMNFRLGKRT
jgi:hypothetical protein